MRLPLLMYQKPLLIFVVSFSFVIFTLFYLISVLIAKPKPRQKLTPEDILTCRGVFCDVTRQSIKDNNKFSVVTNIFKINTYAQFRILYDNSTIARYGFLAPFIVDFRTSSSLGRVLYSNPKDLIFEILLPHGIFELMAGYLSTSLYYSLFINLLSSIFRKSLSDLKTAPKVVFLQILVIIGLYLISAILEGISFSNKLGIRNWF